MGCGLGLPDGPAPPVGPVGTVVPVGPDTVPSGIAVVGPGPEGVEVGPEAVPVPEGVKVGPGLGPGPEDEVGPELAPVPEELAINGSEGGPPTGGDIVSFFVVAGFMKISVVHAVEPR